MAHEDDQAILEHLRHIRAKVDDIAERVASVELRVCTAVELGETGNDMQTKTQVKLDRIARRLGRIENRLALSGPPEA